MKSRAMTIAILMLAFFLKDAVTLVLATGDMASAALSAGAALGAEFSASGPLVALPPDAPGDPADIGPIALPLMLPVVVALPATGPLGELESVPLDSLAGVAVPPGIALLPAGPPMCHAAPFSDSPPPLPVMSNGLQRVTTLGAAGAGGLEAILLSRIPLGASSLLARRRASGPRLVGIVPAVTIPPG